MKKQFKSYLGICFFVMMILAAEQSSQTAAEAGAEPGPEAVTQAATETTLPAVTTYEELLSAIRQTKATSRERVEALVEAEKVRAAWEIGKLIETHVLQNKPRASYDKRVVIRLAKDLETSPTEIWYMLRFAREYPILRPAEELSWSHYQALLALKDPKEREELTEQVVRENWSRDRLREEVRKRQELRKREAQKAAEKAADKGAEQGAQKEQAGESITAKEEVLTATPGKPGTYRVVKAHYGNKPGQLVLDLGFSNYYRPPGRFGFREGDIVKKFKGRLIKSKNASEKDLFAYPVTVIRVIDGDTFTAAVELGFGFTTVQTLRLRALDTPEIESASGREAKEFLETTLPVGSDILVRTSKSDKYDRYLADVWVGENTKAKYVNQELVEKGFAVPVTG